jgi:hypothetical protein
VFVLCWPILVWQINRLFSWSRREGYPNILYTVSRWGFITIVYLGDRQDPDAYRPLPRTFRPLTDPSYASDLPANLATSESLKAVPPLSRLGGGGGISLCEMPEGAWPSPPNTS